MYQQAHRVKRVFLMAVLGAIIPKPVQGLDFKIYPPEKIGMPAYEQSLDEFCGQVKLISPISSGRVFPKAILDRVHEIDPQEIIFVQNPNALTVNWLSPQADQKIYKEFYLWERLSKAEVLIRNIPIPYVYYEQICTVANEVESATSFNFGYWTRADVDRLAPLLYMEYYLWEHRGLIIWKRHTRHPEYTRKLVLYAPAMDNEAIQFYLLRARVDKLLTQALDEIKEHGIDYWEKQDRQRYLQALIVLVLGSLFFAMVHRLEQRRLAKRN